VSRCDLELSKISELVPFVRSYPLWVRMSVACCLLFTLGIILIFIFVKPESEAGTGAAPIVPDGSSGAESANTEKSDMERLTSAFREQHQVRSLRDIEDGLDLSRAPNGVFGFTVPWIIGPQSPLNQQREGTAVVELHKLSNGRAELIAFVSQADALRIEARSGAIEVSVFPEPWKEAATAVSIPLNEIDSSSERSFKYGYVLDLKMRKKG
jgi:hypothetical protein